MIVTALAGGVGAGKFLRGLSRVVDPGEVTAVVNTGDDIALHGLHVSPDLDSVLYWLAGVADRERGWGREGETFRATGELERLGGQAWFSLGDLDLATHLFRADLLAAGATLAEATEALRTAFAVPVRLLPMTNDPVATRIEAVDGRGELVDLHFQEYWVGRGAVDEVRDVRYAGAEDAAAAPGVIEAIAGADVVLLCPSNPVASVRPILAVPGVAEAARGRRVVGVSPIVGGAPVRGMADRLMPAVGLEVTAHGAAAAYRELLDGWVIDERDAELADGIAADLGVGVAVTDTIMEDDDDAARVAAVALGLGSA